MDSEFSKKKALIIGVLLIVSMTIPVTIYVALQQQQDTRTRAEKATVLSLTPGNQTAQASQQLNLDVNIDPGTNQVDFIKMVINFDPTIFNSSSTTFSLDPATTLKKTTSDVLTDGQIVVTLDVGGNPTDVIRTVQKIGTLSLVVQDQGLSSGDTQVTFNDSLIQVRSISETDVYQENVLSSTIPATVTIDATTTTPSPTASVCQDLIQVQNIRIECPNCSSVTPTPEPSG